MFTGIVECTGLIEGIESNGSNKSFWIASPISNELKVDQSVSHNGVCLTVEEIIDGSHKVTAINETLQKTSLNNWKIEDTINIERCMRMDGRLDGHIVQGHVDTTAKCIHKKDLQGSWEFIFEMDKKFGALIIEKGSVAINGISLTCFDITDTSFTVAIVPYTMEHTNMQYVSMGDMVNVEFDVLGKYVQRIQQLKS